MLGVVGPVAQEEGIVQKPREGTGEEGMGKEGGDEVVVRIFNTNTGKVIPNRSRFEVADGRFKAEGGFEMTGVPGTGPRISIGFLNPAGTKTRRATLPTGNVADELVFGDGTRIEASLVDVSNPGAFVRLEDLGLSTTMTPPDVEADAELKESLEEIRQAGAKSMGLDPQVQSVPKIVLVARPAEGDEGVDMRCLTLSMGQVKLFR